MWRRLLVLVPVLISAFTPPVSAQTPAAITSTSAGGLAPVTITTQDGVNADIGSWSGNPNVYPGEPSGCTFLYVDINVNSGGTLSFKYNQRAWGGLWYGTSGNLDEDWLDVYLLTPGTTWDPGTIWSQDGSERCFRQDYPAGVIPLIKKFDFRDYSSSCANGTTSCIRESPELEFTLPLEKWANQSVRVVFRQWTEGSGDETQSRIRNLSVTGCPVTPLTQLTDPDALAFEAGNLINTARLVPNMQTALACIQTAVVNAGGSFPGNVISSAYRPPAYQLHLQEVYDKYQKLKNNRSQACAVRKTEVTTEFNKHGLGASRVRPAGPNGLHTQGMALDMRYQATGLSSAAFITAAGSCDLIQPLPLDPVHFVHR